MEQEELSTIGKTLQATATAVASTIGCQPSDVVCYDHLGTDAANALRCSMCGRLASDVDQPNQVGCIGLGHWIAGDFFCTECRLPPQTS